MKKMKSALLLSAACLIGAGVIGLNSNTAKAADVIAKEDFFVADASIRYVADNDNGNGIRFAILMENETYETWSQKEGATFGAVVLPTDLIPEGESLEKDTTDAVTVVTYGQTEVEEQLVQVTGWTVSDVDGYEDTHMQSVVYVWGIDQVNFNRPMTVVGYADATGETTQYSGAYSNSIAEVALDNLATEEEGSAKYTNLQSYLNEYTVTFLNEDGTEIISAPKTYGETYTATTAPEKTGYNFVGWKARIGTEGGNAVYADTVTDFTTEKKVTSNAEYIAVFEEIETTVTFKYADGTKEEIKATYTQGLEKDPDGGYTDELEDIAIAPYVNGEKKATISAADFVNLTDDTTVEFTYANANNLKYNLTTGEIETVSLEKVSGSSYIDFTTTVTDDFLISADITENTMYAPCIGFSVASSTGSVQFNANNSWQTRVMKNYKWDGQVTIGSTLNPGRVFAVNGETFTFTVAYVDGTVYFYGEGGYMYEYEIDLAATIGAGPYTVQISAWDAEPERDNSKTDTLPLFTVADWVINDTDSDAAAYVAANEIYLPFYSNNTGVTIDRTNKIATFTGTNVSPVFMRESDTFYLAGTMEQAAATKRWQGFFIQTATNNFRMMMQNTGFTNIINGSWTNCYQYNTFPNAFVQNPVTFIKETTATTMKYEIVIQNDMLYAWFDDKLSWIVDLTNTRIGFTAGDVYRIGFSVCDQGNQTPLYKDIVYEYGETAKNRISSTDYLKNAVDSIYAATVCMTVSDNGATIRPSGVSGGVSKLSYAMYKETSSALYLKAKTTVANMEGIMLGAAGLGRNFLFQHQGIGCLVYSWTTGYVSGEIFAYNTFGRTLSDGSKVFYGDAAIAVSSIVEKDVEWVVSEGVLYILINGNAYMKLPLTAVSATWTAATEYQIGFSAWESYSGNGAFKNVVFKSGANAAADIATAVAKYA